MINVENINVFNWEGAVRGMRNPMNSWYLIDSSFGCYDGDNKWVSCEECLKPLNTHVAPCGFYKRVYHVGPKDLALMQKLYAAGSDHRKFMRQIMVSMTIRAPLYWWKEFDTYKVGTVANSCSTMHKIHSKPFFIDDFAHEYLDIEGTTGAEVMDKIVSALNELRREYLATNDKEIWYQMIQLLPTSYIQCRDVTMNYEVAAHIIESRENHKLDEWRLFVKTLREELPYIDDIMRKEKISV